MNAFQPTPVPSAPGFQQIRARLGPVCIALTGTDMFVQAPAAVREVAFVEFRLDSLAAPKDALPALRSFLDAHRHVTAIATCRRKIAGGNFRGSAKQQLEILTEAARAGCILCDLEVETAEELGPKAIAAIRDAGAGVLLSWHDFNGTPNLSAVYDRLKKHNGDFLKICPTARNLTDCLAVLDLLDAHSEDGDLVAFSMGTFGTMTRVLGPRFRSAFTFAALDGGIPTAPGQITARTLLDLYRIDAVGPVTRIYGVAGSPVSHSLSPLMLNTAFRRETVDAVYLPLETANAKELAKVAARIPLAGISVTMPLKQTVMPLLAKADPFSTSAGAVNTIIRGEDGRLFGFNTDVNGVIGPLEKRIPLRRAKVLVLGAGGAARAAVFALRERGAEVHILNRTTDRAAALAKDSGAKVAKRETLTKSDWDVILNATSYGMGALAGAAGGAKGKPSPAVAAPITADEMRTRLFFDMVYNPVETPLVRLARARNIPVVTGAEMFVHQGSRAFEIWTGKPAPSEDMLRVVAHALRSSEPAGEPAPLPPTTTYTPPPKVVPGTASAAPTAATPPAAALTKPATVKKSTPAPTPPPPSTPTPPSAPVKAAKPIPQAKPPAVVKQAPVKQAPAKSQSAKSAPAKVPVKSATKKTPVPAPKKNTPAAQKKQTPPAAAKKTAAKPPVKTAAARKATAKKAVAKKAAPKKATAKKTTIKKR